ncbi:MAG: V-type ATPase 116kDa subunit family protein [Parachlamydiaceae bacterium]
MRYDVKKFLFVGAEIDRVSFFEKAQDAGIVHFIETKKRTTKITSPDVEQLVKAIKVLRGLPVVEQEETDEFEVAVGFAKKINAIKEALNALEEEERLLKLETARVEVFGNFSKEEIADIEKKTGRKIQFYCAKHGYSEKFKLPDELLLVNEERGLEYFIGINRQEMQYPKMIEMEIERPWGELRKRSHEIEKEKHALAKRLKAYAKYNRFLHNALFYQMDQFHLDEAKGFVELPFSSIEGGGLFVVQGWVPDHKIQQMQKFVEKMNVFAEEVGVNQNEHPPTYLENTGMARIGEDLVHIYETPSSRDKDPSLWVLVFFALFFSIIINDGGYGLVFLLIVLYIRYKHTDLKGVKKRFVNLIAILGFSCVAWGILTTSFFGIHVAPDSPLQRFSLMSWVVEKKTAYNIDHQDATYQDWVKKIPALKGVNNPQEFLTKSVESGREGGVKYVAYEQSADNILMEFALLLGVIHVILSMCRNLRRHWAYIGWIILIIGGYLYAPIFLGVVTMPTYIFGITPHAAETNGLYMIYVGSAIGVFLAACQHKIIGILETTIVVQIFGDILSYLRLYALGLAAAMLATILGELAASVSFILGIFILIFGHIINIALGIMLGVIHGLRLNFLEWYHYCFEGGGRMFKPLKKYEPD